MMAVNLWWIDVKSKGAVNNTPPLTTVETGDKRYPYAFHDMMKDLTNSIYNNMVYHQNYHV